MFLARAEKTDSAEIPNDNLNGQDQYVSFPSAGLELRRPKGFADAEDFFGFQQPSTQSSILVSRVAGPYSEVALGFMSPEQFKANGMILRASEDVNIADSNGVLLSVSQTAYGVDFAKWILVIGNEEETQIVTATFPSSEEDSLSAPLKAAVLSTRPDEGRGVPTEANIGFTMQTSAKLKPTKTIGQMALAYTKDGRMLVKSPQEPLLIAAPSISRVPIYDKERFAVLRLNGTAHTRISAVTSNEAITIDGLDGYELSADAEDEDSGEELVVYQVILFDEGRYILIQGLVGSENADEYLPEFKAMAHSLTRTTD